MLKSRVIIGACVLAACTSDTGAAECCVSWTPVMVTVSDETGNVNFVDPHPAVRWRVDSSEWQDAGCQSVGAHFCVSYEVGEPRTAGTYDIEVEADGWTFDPVSVTIVDGSCTEPSGQHVDIMATPGLP